MLTAFVINTWNPREEPPEGCDFGLGARRKACAVVERGFEIHGLNEQLDQHFQTELAG